MCVCSSHVTDLQHCNTILGGHVITLLFKMNLTNKLNVKLDIKINSYNLYYKCTLSINGRVLIPLLARRTQLILVSCEEKRKTDRLFR